MLEYILRYASAHSIQVVQSFENAENHAAIALERELGFKISRSDDDRAEVVASKSLGRERA
jgi:hypothetical protein